MSGVLSEELEDLADILNEGMSVVVALRMADADRDIF
jgi:hypothetical protein